jgi:hypothetical protein
MERWLELRERMVRGVITVSDDVLASLVMGWLQ